MQALQMPSIAALAQDFAREALIAAAVAKNSSGIQSHRAAAKAQLYTQCLLEVLDEAYNEGVGAATSALVEKQGLQIYRDNGSRFSDPRTLN